MSLGLNWFRILFIELSESLSIIHFEWSSSIMILIAFSIAVASAVNIEQLGGNLYSIFLFGKVIDNPTPS